MPMVSISLDCKDRISLDRNTDGPSHPMVSLNIIVFRWIASSTPPRAFRQIYIFISSSGTPTASVTGTPARFLEDMNLFLGSIMTESFL